MSEASHARVRARLHTSRADTQRINVVLLAKGLHAQYTDEFPTWGKALAEAERLAGAL